MRDSTPKTMWACGEADDTDKQQAVHLTWLIILKSLFRDAYRNSSGCGPLDTVAWRGHPTKKMG